MKLLGEQRRGRRTSGSRIPRRHANFRAGVEHRPGAKIHRRQQSPADAGAHRRADRGSARKKPPSRPSSIWPPKCCRCRRCGRCGRASSFRPIPNGSANSTPRSPTSETPDQFTAIAAIKHDMRQPRPMDRLLCGDVGFGKTELAIRAAFKAVDAGYQVAVLVPTTILGRAASPHVHRTNGGVSVSHRSAQPLCHRSTAAGNHRGAGRWLGRYRDRHTSARTGRCELSESRAS